MVAFSRFYAQDLVWENGEETARLFTAHQQAIHVYLADAFLHGIGILMQFTALYVILRPVSRGITLFAAISRLSYVLFWFIVLLEIFSALWLLASAGSLQKFGSDGLAALAGSHIDSSRDAYYIGLTFNGLGSALLSWVLFRSCYFPRSLVLWGNAASLYEGFCSFAYLIVRVSGRFSRRTGMSFHY